MWRREQNLWLIALTFYTRISLFQPSDYRPELLARSNRYLPLVGLVIGLLSSGLGYFASLILPVTAAAVVTVFASILLTGAFHEDGLGDTCDCLGAWSVEKRLIIMKDSRIGTYGALALIFTVLFRVILWSEIPVDIWLWVGAGVHTFSRLLPLFIIASLNYVRDDQQSKVKPVAQTIARQDLIIALCYAVVVLVALFPILSFPFLIALVVCFLLLWLMTRQFFKRLLGGYTGDLLGASQQTGEWLVLLLFVVFL